MKNRAIERQMKNSKSQKLTSFICAIVSINYMHSTQLISYQTQLDLSPTLAFFLSTQIYFFQINTFFLFFLLRESAVEVWNAMEQVRYAICILHTNENIHCANPLCMLKCIMHVVDESWESNHVISNGIPFGKYI